eukprot:gnl/TRDRNA2_/TRDRNA2_177548_c1_seq12.p1 gnl/TRDRNA2_/TRDRNA2_177548_c1~~gnl/TRDRNA2_/TRDRNA2_177548_c1_seq12.p1  ORF type:complete len:686 (+),score=94.05 gnl/TRDRNA2_/TRDRNA2_177548_c1_seq12:124-2058(+)
MVAPRADRSALWAQMMQTEFSTVMQTEFGQPRSRPSSSGQASSQKEGTSSEVGLGLDPAACLAKTVEVKKSGLLEESHISQLLGEILTSEQQKRLQGPRFQQACSCRFAALDLDGSGYLEHSELRLALSQLASKSATDASGASTPPSFPHSPTGFSVQAALAAFDKNGDGRISEDEFSDFVRFSCAFSRAPSVAMQHLGGSQNLTNSSGEHMISVKDLTASEALSMSASTWPLGQPLSSSSTATTRARSSSSISSTRSKSLSCSISAHGSCASSRPSTSTSLCSSASHGFSGALPSPQHIAAEGAVTNTSESAPGSCCHDGVEVAVRRRSKRLEVPSAHSSSTRSKSPVHAAMPSSSRSSLGRRWRPSLDRPEEFQAVQLQALEALIDSMEFAVPKTPARLEKLSKKLLQHVVTRKNVIAFPQETVAAAAEVAFEADVAAVSGGTDSSNSTKIDKEKATAPEHQLRSPISGLVLRVFTELEKRSNVTLSDIVGQVLWRHRMAEPIVNRRAYREVSRCIWWAAEKPVVEEVDRVFNAFTQMHDGKMKSVQWRKIVDLVRQNPVVGKLVRREDADRIFYGESHKSSESHLEVNLAAFHEMLLHLAETIGAHPWMVLFAVGSHAEHIETEVASHAGTATAQPGPQGR